MGVAALVLAVSLLVASIGVSPSLAAGTAAPSADPSQYRLGPNDKIRVMTFGEPTLTGDFFIAGSGNVALPLLGELPAAGMTAPEFQKSVENALRQDYLKNPQVSVEVLTYRPYYILGEVNKPGEYPYTNGLTVMNAVATANGFTYRANKKKVTIRHAGADGERSTRLTSTTPVAPGDTIRIKERFF